MSFLIKFMIHSQSPFMWFSRGYNSRENHMKIIWFSRHFHVKFTWAIYGNLRYIFHVKFTWISREFHIKIMWFSHDSHMISLWISRDIHMEFYISRFTWISREILHMKFTWIIVLKITCKSYETHVNFTWFSYNFEHKVSRDFHVNLKKIFTQIHVNLEI